MTNILVRKYHEFAVDNLSYVTDLEASIPKPEDMVDAWSSLLTPAPELDDLYEPSNFIEPLLQMSQTREEQLKKFLEEQKDRVSDSMIENTKIIELLNNKGLQVFISDGEWRGLQGLEELYPNEKSPAHLYSCSIVGGNSLSGSALMMSVVTTSLLLWRAIKFNS